MKTIAALFLFLILASCDRPKVQENFSQNVFHIKGVVSDSVKPPEVILLESRPKPQTIEASSPIVKPASDHYVMTRLTTDEGLPIDALFSGLVDREGNLWIGTNGAGILKYDGHSLRNFDLKTAGFIIFAIFEDSLGNIWFGTSGEGIRKYDGKDIFAFNNNHGLPSNEVKTIFEDSYGNLWFGTELGVSRYDGHSFKNLSIKDGLAGNNVRSIVEDKNKNLWFGTDSGLSRYDGKTFINYSVNEGLINNNVLAISLDGSGNLWVGTEKGLSRFDGKGFTNFTVQDGLINDRVQYILKDREGYVWFGTTGGISRFDGNNFINFTHENGLSSDNVIFIVEDKLGNLWFGMYNDGLSRFDGESFTNFSKLQGLENSDVRTVLEDKEGNLWFGTKGGVSKYDTKTFKTFTQAQGLPHNHVRSSYEDAQGVLWFGTQGGLSRFDGKQFTNFTTDQGLPDNFVRYILEDKRGLWIGTDKGISLFDGKSFTNYSNEQGFTGGSAWSMTKDKAGNLWIGSLDGTLSRFDGKVFTNYLLQEIASSYTMSLLEDKKGNLWIANAGGALRYDGKTFLLYTTKDGLSNDTIYNIAQTDDGNIAFATNLGLSVLKGFTNDQGMIIPAQNSLTNDELKKYTSIFEIYNAQSGYPVKDGNAGQSSLYLDSRNILWMGNGNVKIGLLKIDFSKLHKSNKPLETHIQRIKINNENIVWNDLKGSETGKYNLSAVTEETITLGKVLTESERNKMRDKFQDIQFDNVSKFYYIPDNLKLPHSLNTVTFEFSAIETDFPQNVLYQYMLEGYDKNWSYLSNQTQANYGNLFEGNYRFKVKSKSPFGIWSKPTIYSFKVLPPWYRTWWAYLLYGASAVIGIYYLVQWRTESLRKRQAQLEELYLATERFVPKNFLTLLNKRNIKEVNLGDSVEIRLSVLFSDIRGFTTISEGLTPKQAFAFVNSYLEVMAPIIRKHHGFINQYHGDGIMALFPRKPDDSVLAVQEMSLTLHGYNIEKEMPLKVGYGLNTGPAMLGIIGEKERMEANVISDTINLASRTESLNKFYGTQFLITQGTFKELSENERFATRLIDKVRVKGKLEAVYLYEVYLQKEIGEEEQNFIGSYESAFRMYEKGDFTEALITFKECLTLKPGNQSVLLFIARCETLLKEPSSQEWDGIFEMKHK